MVLTQGHDKSADYWAFGALVYELLCGHTPFESSNQQRTFEKIVHSQKHLAFPQEFDPHAKSIIRRLLHPNAALRLGSLQNGIDDIKNHAFFAMSNIDFDGLLGGETEMPYLPPPFEMDKISSNTSKVEDLDLNFELSQPEYEDELTYNNHFADLNDPELLE